jgi:nicotinamidase-related amidase
MNATTIAAVERRALLLMDFQRDFLESSGRMPVARGQVSPVLSAAAKALAEARKSGDIIVAIGNEFRRGDILMNVLRRNASIAGSPGSQWTESLPLDGAKYFPKWASSAFVNPELDVYLRAHTVGMLAVTGLFAKACVSLTAGEALLRGYRVQIIAEAVACSSDASRTRALNRLQSKGAALVRA